MTRYYLGAAYAALGRLDDAERALRAAILLQPDHESAHFSLGNVLVRAGRREEGRAQLTRFQELKSSFSGGGVSGRPSVHRTRALRGSGRGTPGAAPFRSGRIRRLRHRGPPRVHPELESGVAAARRAAGAARDDPRGRLLASLDGGHRPAASRIRRRAPRPSTPMSVRIWFSSGAARCSCSATPAPASNDGRIPESRWKMRSA